jgi:hypothetical protein
VSDDDISDKEECVLIDITDESRNGKGCSSGRICVGIGTKNKSEINRNTTVKGICVG